MKNHETYGMNDPARACNDPARDCNDRAHERNDVACGCNDPEWPLQEPGARFLQRKDEGIDTGCA
jgi:hypothetical protein